MDSPASDRISVPRPTQVLNASPDPFTYGTITRCGRSFQNRSVKLRFYHWLPCGCRALQPRRTSPAVWAVPRSLATTRGMISVPRGTEMFQFPRCPSPDLWIQSGDTWALTPGGLPHSEIDGYNACRRLPVAYRSLPRPSSAFGAKASTVRPL